MDAKTLLVCSHKPDTETSRRYFEFSTTPGDTKLAASHKFLVDLLNLTEDLYTVEMGYDAERHMRYVRIRLKTALTLRLQFKDSVHDVELEKGSTVLLLRVWQISDMDIINEYQRVGLKLFQSSITQDRNYLLVILGMEEAETSL
jgi:hypothetical protein